MPHALIEQIDIKSEVADQLGYYVYLYIDPRTGKPFYVGKGKGTRALSHFSEERESKKKRMIRELIVKGLEPRIEILSHGMRTEEAALRVEAAVIDLLGLDSLTNLVSGAQSVQFGRKSLTEINFYYGAKEVNIDDPVLLLGINKLYRDGMTAEELYEATRGTWALDKKRREKVKIVLAVFQGVVREVYEVAKWLPAGTLEYKTSVHKRLDTEGKCEFAGSVAQPELRDKYFGRSVRLSLPKSKQWTKLYKNV